MGFPFYIFFMLLSFAAGLISLYKGRVSGYLRFFPWFLLLTLLIELLGLFMSERGLANLSMYNFFTMSEFVFYLFLFIQAIQKARAKKVILYTIIGYFIFSIINICIIQGLNNFHTISYSIGCLITVAVCIYYFFELFQLTRSVNLLRDPYFWIASGLLFYYSCSLPIIGLNNLFSNFPRVIIVNLGTIVSVLNVLLYSLFTIAFLCRFRIRKSI